MDRKIEYYEKTLAHLRVIKKEIEKFLSYLMIPGTYDTWYLGYLVPMIPSTYDTKCDN